MSLVKRVPNFHLLVYLWLLIAWLAAGPAAAQGSGQIHGGMRSRVLACTACHGLQGRATPLGYYPRIAGKPAGYLYQQLLHFRDGKRSYPQMAYLLEHLTDAYLQEIAVYFSQLDVSYAAPPALQLPTATLAAGQRLAEHGDAARGVPACVQCHGAALTGVAPSVPGLLGLPRDYLNSQLGAWKTGQRRAASPDCMARIAQSLTAEEVSAVSGWLAVQSVPGRGRPAPAFAAPLPLPCGGVDGPVLQGRS